MQTHFTCPICDFHGVYIDTKWPGSPQVHCEVMDSVGRKKGTRPLYPRERGDGTRACKDCCVAYKKSGYKVHRTREKDQEDRRAHILRQARKQVRPRADWQGRMGQDTQRCHISISRVGLL